MAATEISGHGHGSILLLLLIGLTAGHATQSWENLPKLEAFATYEDMQHYFDQRNMRSMRQIDNPTGDSYLAAFNQYNEQLEGAATGSHARTKREQRQLPTAPRMLRFELADAVEPSAEVRQLLRQHHSRNLQAATANATMTTTAAPVASSTATTAPASKRGRKPRRQRRSAVQANRQPANFQVQMIPFEATDAREPDAITAQLIKQARALDVQQSARPVRQAVAATEAPLQSSVKGKPVAAQRPYTLRIRKTKRSKRAAPLQVFKFEISDAKMPPVTLQRTPKKLESELLIMETEQRQATQNQTESQLQSTVATTTPRVDDNLVLTGESTAESKRMLIYKEAPQTAHAKTKKSISSLPHEVQKVISQLMKDGHGGKAIIKYLPAPQKSDYESYKAKPLTYALKPGSYVKYVSVPAKTTADPVHVHIQPVPVVEQLRYVYKPVYVKQQSHVAAVAPTLGQPIVVQDTAAPAEQVHHTYSAAELPVQQHALPVQQHALPADIVTSQFHASKPDPLHQQAELDPSSAYLHAGYGSAHIRPVEHYKYQLPAEHNQAPSPPLIKIEYHAAADGIKDHYKEMPEFQQLSTLIGKSPDDQIHGLTYLLAKEMQSKLVRQGKQLAVSARRPQDSTAPILFHPSDQQAPLPTPNLKSLADHGSLGVQPGRLIGMAKTKQYVPIIEPGNNDVKELPVVNALPAPKLPTPSSFIDFMPGHGLSHGYEGVSNEHPHTTLEHTIQHPTLTQHALLNEEKAAPAGLHYITSQQDKTLQQYASKYAFGYRIRDFHTGNDFGHKQNRDLHGVTRGQYHILLPDGRIQNVIYHADDTGFHADVSFESGSTGHH